MVQLSVSETLTSESFCSKLCFCFLKSSDNNFDASSEDYKGKIFSTALLCISLNCGNALKIRIPFTLTNVDDHAYIYKLGNKTRKKNMLTRATVNSLS